MKHITVFRAGIDRLRFYVFGCFKKVKSRLAGILFEYFCFSFK